MVGNDHLTALKELSCTDLSDAMDRLGIACQAFEIKPLSHTFNLAG